MNILNWLQSPPTNGPKSTILLRFMAGGVFLWEGCLKFAYTNQGLGRFTKLGFPEPEILSNFVGIFEIGGGLLLLLGWYTRWISIPFIVEMVVAILTTKVALYLGTSPLPLPASPPQMVLTPTAHSSAHQY